jgi:hypothetical protein
MLSHATCKRLMAVLLSASFVWAAMACVSLCLLHCSEEEICAMEISSESGRAVSSDETTSSHESELVYTDVDSCCESDNCPIQPMPVCALQKSSSFEFQANNNYHISIAPSGYLTQSIGLEFSRDLIPHSSSDPPFERLCTLRI